MKKLKFLSALFLILGLTACEYKPYDDGDEPIIPGGGSTEPENPDSEEPSEPEGDGLEATEFEPDEWEEPNIPSTNTDYNGYYRLNNSNLVYDQWKNLGAAPHTGETKMLVIPIKFDAGTSNNLYNALKFTNKDIRNINSYFFGEKTDTPENWNSLRTYFQTTSQNMITIGGLVTDVYKVTGSDYTVKKICDSVNSYVKLQTVFLNAVEWVVNSYKNVDWTTYDRNGDGYIDNLHLITNLTKNATAQGEEQPFWPHKWEISIPHSTGTPAKPSANTYETTAIGHLEDARTIIHEQSHVFGVEDYYDYAYLGADYLGYLDMQSFNVFDWNSFSKFAVGWSRPYVVDGTENSTTITINSAATSNECIVIPANHSSFNGSAFDEYFLIELFTRDGNNALDWTEETLADATGLTQDYGIRLYHVDGRMHNSDGVEFDIATAKQVGALHGCSNSNADKATGKYTRNEHPEWVDFKLLTLIQAGGINTFGEFDGDGNYDFLTSDDLFQTGDIFTFSQYRHFLSKTGKTVTTMDNGETFPYIITFDSVTRDTATITFTK